MVYKLGIDIAKAWYHLKTQHGAIGLYITTEGRIQIQLKDKRKFDSLQGTTAVSTYENDGTKWRQSIKTFGATQYLLLEVINE